MNDGALSLLGLARKAGRIEIGEEPAGSACRARKARLLILACDAAPRTRRQGERLAQAGNAAHVTVPFTKAQLGAALGRESCALAALTDAGMAHSLLRRLAGDDPERYGEAAELLSAKAARILRRRREKRRHGKNTAKGKKPRAAPPKG